jgi:hypothetical protein
VIRLSQRGQNALGARPQRRHFHLAWQKKGELVAGGVTKRIVDPLEVVEIDEYQRRAARPSVAPLRGEPKPMQKHAAVRQTRNLIGVGEQVHPDDVGVEPVHHGAERIGEPADLAIAVDLHQRVEIARHDRIGAASQRHDAFDERARAVTGDDGRRRHDDGEAASARGDVLNSPQSANSSATAPRAAATIDIRAKRTGMLLMPTPLAATDRICAGSARGAASRFATDALIPETPHLRSRADRAILTGAAGAADKADSRF